MTALEHTIEHCEAPLDERKVRAALVERTTLQAAELLGVTHMTLRRRFDHLLTKRRSPGADFPPDVVARVRELAADPTVSTREASRRLNMSQVTMRTCRRIHGIEWVSAPRGNPNHRKART